MRSILFIILVSIALLNPNEHSAQVDLELTKQNIIEQRLEIIASNIDESVEVDYTNLFESLSYFFEHPINLNRANPDDLRELYLLTDLQINALQTHIAKFGSLKSIYELQSIRGFDLMTIRNIQPFVTVVAGGMMDGLTWKNLLKEGRSDVFLRYRRTVQQQAGYIPDTENNEPAAYQGTPNYLYSRYRFTYRRNLSVGFTLENDAGESLKKGPDFYSAHIFIRNDKRIKALAIGDFQAQFGQGLTFWNGLGFGKSPFVMNVKKNAQGLRAYTSVNESLYLRGAGTTISLGKFDVTAFASLKKIDGNAIASEDTVFTDDNIVVSSLLNSGFHRTENEIEDKKAVTETIFGGNIKYSTRTFSLGATATHLDYSARVSPNQQLYQINRFKGTNNTNIGIDYQKVFRNFNFFGEFSRSANGGYAALNGFVGALHPRLSVSAVHRYFSEKYQVEYFNVFAENSEPQNERGLFVGMEANIAKGWTLSAYSDQIVYPWLRYNVQRPGSSTDYFFQLNYKPDRKQDFYIRYRVRNGEEDGKFDDEMIDYPVAKRQQNFRFNAIYQPHPNVQMRSRAEWNVFEKVTEGRSTGFLLYQDVIWKKMGSKWSFNVRYAMFNTPNYDTRIYAYESDVLYAFSIPGYYGQGSRVYGLVKWDVKRGVDVWVRYAQWMYTDRNTISSGNSEILGNKKGDITAQVRIQF